MFTSIEMLQKRWQSESKDTIKILDNLTDESLAQAVCDDHRSLGRMAWHIVTTIPEMCNQMGIKLKTVSKDDPVPSSASDISTRYSKAITELLDLIKSDWSDDTLKQEDNLYGETWSRGLTLDILLRHEIHHRGQMTVLMRQAGLGVPGVYGPSKEEWANFGGQPPEV